MTPNLKPLVTLRVKDGQVEVSQFKKPIHPMGGTWPDLTDFNKSFVHVDNPEIFNDLFIDNPVLTLGSVHDMSDKQMVFEVMEEISGGRMVAGEKIIVIKAIVSLPEKKEVGSDDKLIAEFMGGIPYYLDNNLYVFPAFENPGVSKNGTTTHHLNNLKYDTSWDWLMPVVEKINYMPDIKGKMNESITQWSKVSDSFHNDPAPKNIDNVYKAVLEYIKWYNLNTKPL